MKQFWIAAVMMTMTTVFAARSSFAQVSISVNIGSQPAWAPEGYDDATYYYIPDMDIYYDVAAHQFVYLSGNRWVRSATLPGAYRKYDLYKVHKVALNGRNPYEHHDRDKKEYAQFRGKHDQSPIRDSRDDKYTDNKNNWQNNHFANSKAPKGRERSSGKPNDAERKMNRPR